MQDKLIEAAQRLKVEFADLDSYGTFVKKVVCADESWPYVQISTGAWLMLKARISGVIEALAAVRAHDAGKDEGLRFFKPTDQETYRRIYAAMIEGYTGNVIGGDAQVGGGMAAFDEVITLLKSHSSVPRASDAAESAPPEPEWRKCPQCKRENSFASWEMNLGKCPNCDDLFSKESAPQLDAKDPAEPVEDVVSRMCKLMGGCACEHCIKRMTASLAFAREGYWSQQAVEKGISAAWSSESRIKMLSGAFLDELRARHAALAADRRTK